MFIKVSLKRVHDARILNAVILGKLSVRTHVRWRANVNSKTVVFVKLYRSITSRVIRNKKITE